MVRSKENDIRQEKLESTLSEFEILLRFDQLFYFIAI